MAPDILSVVLRALSFVLQLQAAGTVFFVAAFGPASRTDIADWAGMRVGALDEALTRAGDPCPSDLLADVTCPRRQPVQHVPRWHRTFRAVLAASGNDDA